MILDVSPQQVDIFFEVIYLSICTFCLDEAEVDAILDGTTLVGAVPSSSRIGPFKEFLPPPIKYVGMELSDVLVSALGFVDVVDAVSVW